MNEPAIVTRSEIVRALRELGVATGQTVMLHSSVASIGWVVGGPQVVLEALFEVLSSTGTLLVFVSFEDDPYQLHDWSEVRQRAYLSEFPPYDPERSRADRKNMGILAEYLRTWPRARRSSHPFSYVAVGPEAEFLTRNHSLNYRDGMHSPLARLCELEGFVVTLGAPLSAVTLLHHAEFLAHVPGKRIVRYKLPILKDKRRIWVDIEEFDTTLGIVDWPGDYFESIMNAYVSERKLKSAKVGQASSYFFPAADLRDFGVEWMEKNFCGDT